METVNENNLSISEFQDVNELNVEELDAVAGGVWGAVGFVVDLLFGGSDEPSGNESNSNSTVTHSGNVTVHC